MSDNPTKPKALDLFCKAGGASMGLHQAGFDVTGVDIEPQPRYPFRFIQADAMEVPLDGYDFIWASPPCQAFTALQNMHNAKSHPDLLTPMRDRLWTKPDVPHVIENVPGAPLRHPLIILCGTMFGLQTSDGTAELRRHRVFEVNFPIGLVPPCSHRAGAVIGVYGGHGRDRRRTITVVSKQGGYKGKDGQSSGNFSIPQRQQAMGIDWMKDYELSQAIPPAYSKYIGEFALQHIREIATEHG
jgi:DNA (cytosine-5)-methyltransferase 1